MPCENGVNVKLITILEDNPSYNFCLKENFLIFLLMAY